MRRDYDRRFYSLRHRKTVHAARAILPIVLGALREPGVRSAVDFGGGVGTWLAVLKKMGVRDVLALDGPWVDQDLLVVSPAEFRVVDFEKRIDLGRRYDLAISLEVGEHLPEQLAPTFLDSLTAASDCVLFSAAIPFQGGRRHLNEQWPGFWARLFRERGYVGLDFIRRRVWNDDRIPFWYRQNILLFVKREKRAAVKIEPHETDYAPLPLVHPELYLSKVCDRDGGGT